MQHNVLRTNRGAAGAGVTVNLRLFKGAKPTPQPSFDAHGLRAYKNAPALATLSLSDAHGLRPYKGAKGASRD